VLRKNELRVGLSHRFLHLGQEGRNSGLLKPHKGHSISFLVSPEGNVVRSAAPSHFQSTTSSGGSQRSRPNPTTRRERSRETSSPLCGGLGPNANKCRWCHGSGSERPSKDSAPQGVAVGRPRRVERRLTPLGRGPSGRRPFYAATPLQRKRR